MATGRNTARIIFNNHPNVDPTHYSLWTALTGGTYLGGDAISQNVRQPQTGDTVAFPAGMLIVDFPHGELTEPMMIRALNGALAGNIYIQTHSAAQGANGTDNVIPGQTRAVIALAQWTIAFV